MKNPFVLLYAFWQSTPPPFQAALVSATFTLNTALGIAVALFAGSGDNNGTNVAFVYWLENHWLFILLGAVYGGASASTVRGLQAAGKLPSNTVGPPPPIPIQEPKP